MQFGMIGLGRMGGNMTERCMLGGHELVVYDRDTETVESYVEKSAVAATLVPDLVSQLTGPKVVWLMLPSGAITEAAVSEVSAVMQAYAEGFDILRHADSVELPEELRLKLPLGDIAEVWRRGSVVSPYQ